MHNQEGENRNGCERKSNKREMQGRQQVSEIIILLVNKKTGAWQGFVWKIGYGTYQYQVVFSILSSWLQTMVR